MSAKGEGLYNVIAIGAGAAGLITTAAIAGLGGRAALIEKGKMGGDCLNFGCVPSKGIISSARLVQQIREAEKWGLNKMSPDFAFEKVFESMRGKRAEIEPNDSVERFEGLGVDVFQGAAKFVSPNEVEVNGQTLKAKHIVIAAGSRAMVPPIEGFDEVPYFTNEAIFDKLNKRPDRMAVIGGGPIGTELGQALNRLGVEVHLIQRGSQILPKEDPEVAELIHQKLASEGMKVLLDADVIKGSHTDGKTTLTIDRKGNLTDLEVDAVFVATGRTPNIESLNLEAAGVRANKRGIEVNDFLQTSQPHIYAAGDIAGHYQFTHLSDYHARTVVENMIRTMLVPGFVPQSLRLKKVDYKALPWATYTSPEVAQVGLNEKAAKEKGIDYDVHRVDAEHLDRFILERQTEGFIKILTEKGKDTILGATIVSEHAGDLIHELAVAIQNGVGLGKVASTIHAYPTHAEIVRRAADAYKKTTFTPKLAAMFKKKFAKQIA